MIANSEPCLVGQNNSSSVIEIASQVAFEHRHATSLEALVDAHFTWTLDVSLDEAPDVSKPAVLSPFLPSLSGTITGFLSMFPELGPDDCILDIG